MATGKAIRLQIASIKSTQKITRAMQLVAASKIRKAQLRMLASQPYAEKVQTVIGHIANSHSEFHNIFLEPRETVKGVGFIVIGSDRGLCGGLNNNLFKMLLFKEFPNWKKQNIPIFLTLIGRKTGLFFKNAGHKIISHAERVSESPIADIRGSIRAIIQCYMNREIDRLYVVGNEFINTMVQKPKIQQLLPLEVINDDSSKYKCWDYIYEPDVMPLLEKLIVRYFESQVYQAMLSNTACEHAARMVAMKNATDNANELINDLQLIYNKTRQATITKELSEIIGGAAAL
jgi:F-type H+-transporting ATPase subunit gamma